MVMFILAFVLLLTLSFLIALLLNNKLKAVDFSKAMIFSLAIIAPIIVGIIWVYILDPNIGIINNVLDAIGADSLKQTWIGGEKLSPYSIAIIYFWQQLGYLVTIFIAGEKIIAFEKSTALSLLFNKSAIKNDNVSNSTNARINITIVFLNELQNN